MFELGNEYTINLYSRFLDLSLYNSIDYESFKKEYNKTISIVRKILNCVGNYKDGNYRKGEIKLSEPEALFLVQNFNINLNEIDSNISYIAIACNNIDEVYRIIFTSSLDLGVQRYYHDDRLTYSIFLSDNINDNNIDRLIIKLICYLYDSYITNKYILDNVPIIFDGADVCTIAYNDTNILTMYYYLYFLYDSLATVISGFREKYERSEKEYNNEHALFNFIINDEIMKDYVSGLSPFHNKTESLKFFEDIYYNRFDETDIDTRFKIIACLIGDRD
jgi:hypothetical protein